MINKHGNWKYNSNVPNSIGDRYYSQDKLRDFLYAIDKPTSQLNDILYQLTPGIISGGLVTKGSGNTLTISPCVGFTKYSVEIPDSFSSVPPTKTSTDLECIRVESTLQTDMAIPSAILDNVTTNYVKLRYVMADGNTRNKQRAGGSYSYEQNDSFEFIVDTVSPTSYDICLCEFVSVGGNVPTVFNTDFRSIEFSQFYNDDLDNTVLQCKMSFMNPVFLTQSAGQITLNASVSEPFIATIPVGISNYGKKKHYIKLTSNVSPSGWNLSALANSMHYHLYIQFDEMDQYIYSYTSGSDVYPASSPINGALSYGRNSFSSSGTYFVANENKILYHDGSSYLTTKNYRLYVGVVYKNSAGAYTIHHRPIRIERSRLDRGVELGTTIFNYQLSNGDGIDEIYTTSINQPCIVSIPKNYSEKGRRLFIKNKGAGGTIVRPGGDYDFSINTILSQYDIILPSVGDFVELVAGESNWRIKKALIRFNTGWLSCSDWTYQLLGPCSIPIGAITGTPIFGESFYETVATNNKGKAWSWSSGSQIMLRDVSGAGFFTAGRTLQGSQSGATMVIGGAGSKNVGTDYTTFTSSISLTDMSLHTLRMYFNTSASQSGAYQLSEFPTGASIGGQKQVYPSNNNILRYYTGASGISYLILGTGNLVTLVGDDAFYHGVLEFKI
jgi:hypothetical protein